MWHNAAGLTMDELKFAAAVLNPEIMVHAPRSDAGGAGVVLAHGHSRGL